VLPRLAYLTLCRSIQLLTSLVRGDAAKELEILAGSRARSTSTRLTHPIITSQTSPHFAEALTPAPTSASASA
jgi:hypothetical protein